MRYSVLPIYPGRVYRGTGYYMVACWTPFFSTYVTNFADMVLKSAIFFMKSGLLIQPHSLETIFSKSAQHSSL